MSYYKGTGYGGGRGGGSGGYRGSSYRGSRGSGDSSSWRGGSRSSFGAGRGGGSSGKYYDSMPSYDSRSKPAYMSGGSDRYSGRSRADDYRYSSQAMDDYGPRYVRASPDPPRKRVRTDASPSYNMASRRSHERSFSSNDYSGRGFYDKGTLGGGYMTDKGSYREVRETRAADYPFRKPGTSFSPRGGSFRGRSVRGIRSTRRGFRTGSSFLARKKMAESYGIRKRLASRSRDYFRRLKRYRMKRSGLEDDDKKKGSDDEQDDDDDDDDDDAEKDDEEVEEEEEESVSGEEEVEDDEKVEGEDKEVNEEGEGGVKSEKEGDEGEEAKEKPAAEKKTQKKKKVTKKKKTPEKKEKKDGEEGEKEDKEKESKEEGKEDEKPLTNFLGQKFIQLKCPHCGFTCATFKEYSRHLSTKKHLSSMQTLSSKLRAKLSAMRIEQRVKQRQLDEESKSKNLRLSTFFCSICKLNYRTLKSSHQTSISHKKMKAFVLPYCRICETGFKTPWAYESHLCELLHIKRKARAEKLARPPIGPDDVEALNDLDTSHFMVLDAVGSGDDDKSDDEATEAADGEKKEGEEGEKKKKKKKDEIKLGAEYCKLVEVFFCELCKIYLPRIDDKDRTLTLHCRSRTHLQRYVRHRDDRSLRRRAVKLHKEHEKEKELLKTSPKKSGEEGEEKSVKTEQPERENASADDATAKKEEPEGDDKIWSEVDKDLSNLLQENEEPAKSDDDDDSRQEGERYDRFKQSDKTDKAAADAAAKNAATTANGSLSTSEKKKIVAGEEK